MRKSGDGRGVYLGWAGAAAELAGEDEVFRAYTNRTAATARFLTLVPLVFFGLGGLSKCLAQAAPTAFFEYPLGSRYGYGLDFRVPHRGEGSGYKYVVWP